MLKRVFITVLTYPTPSHKYIETVCTAGITADGEWIRIYPIQLRLLNATKKETARIRKYCWYTFNLEPRTRDKDMRKESHFCVSLPTTCEGHVDTRDGWKERKQICLRTEVFHNYSQLEVASDTGRQDFISLATFKPKEIIDFVAVPKDPAETEREKNEVLENLRIQAELIEGFDIPEYWKMAQSIPYTFYYVFKDDSDTEYRLMVEDWETMMLYLNCRNQGEQKAIEKVRDKYFNEFKNKDLYFFMGTRREAHLRRWKKPYSIVGVFYPPKEIQPELELFDKNS